jgi:hypothetical protein
MKKGDDVAGDDDNDVMRENQCVTRLSDSDIVYWWIVPQDPVYIAISTYQTGQNVGGGDTDSQHDTFTDPTGFHTSQLVFHSIYRVSNKHRFSFLFCDWGRQIKLIFLFPKIHYLWPFIAHCTDLYTHSCTKLIIYVYSVHLCFNLKMYRKLFVHFYS